eukprot:PhF_6_TR1545/c0_g1_i1/m.2817
MDLLLTPPNITFAVSENTETPPPSSLSTLSSSGAIRSRTLTLTNNDSIRPIAFKIKTTHTQKYIVTPRRGFLAPLATIKIIVSLQYHEVEHNNTAATSTPASITPIHPPHLHQVRFKCEALIVPHSLLSSNTLETEVMEETITRLWDERPLREGIAESFCDNVWSLTPGPSPILQSTRILPGGDVMMPPAMTPLPAVALAANSNVTPASLMTTNPPNRMIDSSSSMSTASSSTGARLESLRTSIALYRNKISILQEERNRLMLIQTSKDNVVKKQLDKPKHTAAGGGQSYLERVPVPLALCVFMFISLISTILK